MVISNSYVSLPEGIPMRSTWNSQDFPSSFPPWSSHAFAQLLTRRCSRGASGDKELMATWKASEALGDEKLRKKAGAPNYN